MAKSVLGLQPMLTGRVTESAASRVLVDPQILNLLCATTFTNQDRDRGWSCCVEALEQEGFALVYNV